MVIILMGVSGSGKTTVGKLLAESLQWKFVEGDAFHPQENLQKMAGGIPLTDSDRAPWLHRLREEIEQFTRRRENAVLSCSALKEKYRDLLAPKGDVVAFVYLKGTPGQLRDRLEKRQGHFMGPAMLESQLAALEEPQDAFVVDIATTPEKIIAAIRSHFHL